jgi:hypothetical protein
LGDNPIKKKYHLMRWSDVCLPKDQGGLGNSKFGFNEYCASSKMDLEIIQWFWPMADHS